jgi:SAM-dependent methyltransferase
MSGFSPDWLALRETADRRARSPAIDGAVAAALAHLVEPRICDLGAGTGASLRALAPLLGPRQHWVLMDHDPALAAAARARLSAQADAARDEGADLVLDWGGRALRVSFAAADLAADPAAPLAFAPDFVTASAFFDLASADWCRAFAAAMADAGVMVHAALTCDGADEWLPPHPADLAVHAAFKAHQARDKGFGRAAGPEAAAILAGALTASGRAVMVDESPWRLGPDDRALIGALADGTAGAAREQGGVDPDALASWQAARRQAASCRIGHLDLFARPSR